MAGDQMTEKTYDAIIIGAGQSGIPLAERLGEKQWKVALIERSQLGGSCINYGCTPTKKMIASARVAHLARRAADFGIQAGPVQVDMKAVQRLKDEAVLGFRAGLQRRIDSHPSVELIREEASFCGPYTVQVGKDQIRSEKIFIDTGTHPLIPAIEGLESVPYLTNDSILELEEVPEHLLVVGGSYIGLEFGQMFRRLGSRVTVIEYGSHIVSHEDDDISECLQQILEEEGIQFMLGTRVARAEKKVDGSLRLVVTKSSSTDEVSLQGTHILLAVGRSPNTTALNLSAAGIHENDGWIPVNEYLETNVPGIYALGDVNHGPAFTHISYNDYLIVYHNLFHDEKRATSGRLVPYALFTDPELGRVGLSERQARHQGYRIKVGTMPMNWIARAIERSETQGMMKIVVNAEDDQILGAAVLGAEGGELIQTLMTLMMAKATWKLFSKAIFIHPTLTEGFYTLMDQVEKAEVS